jgi:prohibitin 1
MDFAEMAAQFFNRVGQIGLAVALVGGVVNSALYNGKGIV